MDVLADVLSITRLGATLVAQAELLPPWGLQIDPIAEAHVHVVLRGSCWLRTTAEHRLIHLRAGDIVLIRGTAAPFHSHFIVGFSCPKKARHS